MTRKTMHVLANSVKLLFKSNTYGDYVLYDKLLIVLRDSAMS